MGFVSLTMASVFLSRTVRPLGRLTSVFRTPTRSITKIMDEDFNLEYLEGAHEGIAVCSFTRPEAKNAISRNLAKQMRAAVDMLKFEKDLRVAILRSQAPGIFCAGADL